MIWAMEGTIIGPWIGFFIQVQALPAYHNAWPQWSPDGRQMVFASTRDGDWEIYVARADGTAPRRLTNSPGRDAHPMFTPDGLRIVFQSPRGRTTDNQADLYVMDADGGNQRRVVEAPGFNGVPVPSPDGQWVAFQRGSLGASGDYHWELYLVDSAGRQERQLTANPWSSQVPNWSPDGRRLVFYADPQGREQLFFLDVESGTVTPLAPSHATDNAPAFSPDGRSVAFVSTRHGPRDLYRVNVATGAVTCLTQGLDVWAQPSWSADGRRLLFSATTEAVNQLYVVGADGTGLLRLAVGPAAGADAGSLVLVALSAHDSVVALDGATLERRFAVATGRAPHEIVATRDARRAFVANTGGASVSVIDIERQATVATHGLGDGSDPHDVELSADERTLWVTVARQRALIELDTKTGMVRARHGLPADGGWMVDAGPEVAPVVVAHLEGGGLGLLDPVSRRVEFRPLAAGEIEAVLSPDGATIWSSNFQTDRITVTDAATGARLVSLAAGGRSPVRVLVTPDAALAIAANAGSNHLSLFDARNRAPLGVIPLPQSPKVLAASPDGQTLYVSHPEPGGVSLIDLNVRRVARTVPLPGVPDGLAVLTGPVR